MDSIKLLTGLLSAYLLGSIPTAFIFGRLTKGIDLRLHGSGNLGATNAFRVLGKKIGSIVLGIDIFKGTAAVLLASLLFPGSATAPMTKNTYLCLTAVAAVCGHNWTVFLKFKGGKGVATSLGVLIAFSLLIEHFLLIVLLILGIWTTIFLVSGFVSLASVACSALLPFLSLAFHLGPEITLFLGLLGIFSLIRHKSNISRLLHNRENRFHPLKIFRRRP